MTGAERIAREREKQIKKWGAAHDDEHTDGALADAAACYASTMPVVYVHEDGAMLDPWPWDKPSPTGEKVGPSERIRRLTIAGALIAAEIDRLERRR